MFLAWQAPDHLGDRFRWAVGRLVALDDGEFELSYFSGAEFSRFNQGRAYEDMAQLSYQGYPGLPLGKGPHQRGVARSFLRRLPPSSRSDYQDFLDQFRLSASTALSPAAVLARTEAKLPSDGFSVVDPLDPNDLECDLMLEIAGYRYYAGNLPTAPVLTSEVDVCAEPENEHDSGAVQIVYAGTKIGNINRLQAPTFLKWLGQREITACLERLNGRPERPRAFVFVKVRPRVRRAA